MGRNIRGQYPHNWPEIARDVKDAAGWRCVRCGHPHESPKERKPCDDGCDLSRHPEWGRVDFPEPGRPPRLGGRLGWDERRQRDGFWWVREGHRQRVLTVAHLDDDKSNCRWWNVAALCQVCHLSTQSRIDMDRQWLMTLHSAWFRPYVAGFYAFKYLGQDLTREDVTARLDDLLGLEARAAGVSHG